MATLLTVVWDQFRQDTRYALRSARRAPGFACVAILTLALGIGATTAIYSVVDTVLLQPLPFTDSDRLVRVVENVPSRVTGRVQQRGITYPDFLEWRTRARTLSDMVAVSELGRIVKTRDGMTRLWGGMVSPETFTLLGSRPMLGRTLDVRDGNAPDVAVLDFHTWRGLFHADPGVVGSTIELRSDWNGSFTPEQEQRLLTIVGVLPASFEFPTGPMDFYTPFVLNDLARRSPVVTLMAHVRDGVSMRDAAAEANTIGAAIRPPRPANAPPLTMARFDVEVLKDRIVSGLRPALRIFLVAVAAVLLIVCANVANLLLARGTVREREIAVRVAIGAGRGRIVRQILTECLVLAACGGVLGAAVGVGGVWLVKTLASVDAPGIFRFAFSVSLLPRVQEIGINPRMFGIALAIAAITSVVFGILPAMHLSRAHALHSAGARSTASRGVSRIRGALIVAQFVMATVLLVGAGLLIRSFIAISTVDSGYNASQLLTFQLVFPADYSVGRKAETIDALLTRLRATPDVEAAGFTRAGVLIPEEISVGTFVPPGRTLDDMRADTTRPRLRPVSDGFLTALGVRLLEGRELTAGDTATAPPVAVISRIVAQRYFGAQSPVGQHLQWYVGDARRGARPAPVPVQVIGVVDDIRNESPEREAFPEIFVEYRQLLALEARWGDSPHLQNETTIGFSSFAIRTRRDPSAASPAVARIARSVDPDAGVESLIPMERLVSSSLARPRFYAVLLGVFAGIAGMLAAIGIYGVLAYAVVQRTQEIGVRMALGAGRAQVLALVLRQGATLAAIGIAAGLVGAATVTRLLQGMLFGVTALDPHTFVAVSVLFGVVAMLAAYVPARRATRIDPMVALRVE